MNSKIISRKIRVYSLKRLIFPLIIIILFSLIFFKYKLHLHLLPLHAGNVQELSTDKYKNQKYVSLSLSKLSYTGYDCKKNGNVVGSYYYYLEDGQCTFFLLKPNTATLTDVYIEARLLPINNYEKLIAMVSSDLKWNMPSLNAITGPYMVSEIDYRKDTTFVIYALCLVLVSIALANFLLLILAIALPFFGMNTKELHSPKYLYNTLKNAEAEIKELTVFNSNNIYITDTYLISLNPHRIHVIPLEKIVWAYKYSVLKKKPFKKDNITYTLHFVSDSKKHYVCPNNHKYEADSILEYISERMPEVLVGYSKDEM